MTNEAKPSLNKSTRVRQGNLLRVCRLILYVVLFSTVLGCGVMVKLWFLTLVANYSTYNYERRSFYDNQLMLCLVLPVCPLLFSNLELVLFGKVQLTMKIKQSIPIIVLEVMPAIGIGLMLFKVLPHFNSLLCIVVTMTISVIPLMFCLFESLSHVKKRRCNRNTLMLLVCLFIQLNIMSSLFLFDKKSLTCYSWISCLLVSVGFWENFAHGNVTFAGFNIKLKKMRQRLCSRREKIKHVLIFAKISVIILCRICFVQTLKGTEYTLNSLKSESQGLSLEWTNTSQSIHTQIHAPTGRLNKTNGCHTTKEGLHHTRIFSVKILEKEIVALYEHCQEHYMVFLVVICSFALTRASTMAYAMNMQKIAFSLPVILVSPLAGIMVVLKCNSYSFISGILSDELQCPITASESFDILLYSGTPVWICLVLLTCYIWEPAYQRYTSIFQLFVCPLNGNIFSDMNMLLRRKKGPRYTKRRKYSNFKSRSRKVLPDRVPSPEVAPSVYICVPMWHENKQEMTQLLKSLFRIDQHCAARRKEKIQGNIHHDEYYPEINIFFDDAFETDLASQQRIPNQFVFQLIDCIDTVAKTSADGPSGWTRLPTMISLPYGARMAWTLPGGTLLTLHLKDKSKIRNRKRWTQLMYMLYILGYKVLGQTTAEQITSHNSSKLSSAQKHKLKNTFLLMVDGDVEFEPESVPLLLESLRSKQGVAGVCGRIIPIGSGPMVWFQQFEYAIGHWFQKTSEHVLGCCLVNSGCFSMFTGTALFDSNFIFEFAEKPTEARHYIQCEQGEDRWISTLLIKHGYKTDFFDGAHAVTFAPDTLGDFFIQMRRWMASLIVNHLDIISSWRSIVYANTNICIAYIVYMAIMLVTMFISPSFISFTLAETIHLVFHVDLTIAYIMVTSPIGLYVLICLQCSRDVQLRYASIFSIIYSVVLVFMTMLAVLFVVEEDLFSTYTILPFGYLVIITIAALCHPYETHTLKHGLLYLVRAPPMNILFLTVFYLCTINDVSWGTRDVPVKETEDGAKFEKAGNCHKPVNAHGGYELVHKLFTNCMPDKTEWLYKTVSNAVTFLFPDDVLYSQRQFFKCFENFYLLCRGGIGDAIDSYKTENKKDEIKGKDAVIFNNIDPIGMTKGILAKCANEEEDFWRGVIKVFLEPLPVDETHKKKMSSDLEMFRNKIIIVFILMNLVLSVTLLHLHTKREDYLEYYICGKYEPVIFLGLVIHASAILVQFIAMLHNRAGDFQRLIARTSIRSSNILIKSN